MASYTILYSVQKKRERNSSEQLLNHDLEIFEKQLQSGIDDIRLREDYESKKAALEYIHKYQAQGAFVRSRAEYKV